ncbi:MAG: hypothetical protein Q9221_008159 [Calogaya cf. arnoldii]
MTPYEHHSESREIKEKAQALTGRKMDFKTASKFLTQRAKKERKSHLTQTSRSGSILTERRVHESAESSQNRTQTGASQSRATQVQPTQPANGSKKRGKDANEEPQLGRPSKRSKSEEHDEQPSRPAKHIAQPRARPPQSGRGAGNKTAPRSPVWVPSSKNTTTEQKAPVTGRSSENTTTEQKAPVTRHLKRKTEDGHYVPVKKAKVEVATISPVLTSAPTPTASAAGSPKPTETAYNTSIKASRKRKAEEDIGTPIKKPRVEKPAEKAVSTTTSQATTAEEAQESTAPVVGAPIKKPRVAKPAEPILTTAPTPTTSPAGPAKPTPTANNTSTKATPKRKAEVDIGASIKKPRVEHPVTNATSDHTSKTTEDPMVSNPRNFLAQLHKARTKRGAGGRSTKQPTHGIGKSNWRYEDRNTKPDTVKIALVKDAQVKGSEEEVVESDKAKTAEVKEAEADEAEEASTLKLASTLAQLFDDDESEDFDKTETAEVKEAEADEAEEASTLELASTLDQLFDDDESEDFDKTETAEVKEAEADEAEEASSPEAEEQDDSDVAEQPAPMANASEDGDLMCFANSVIQVIDSIPELRDRLIAKGKKTDNADFPAFPPRIALEQYGEEMELQWHREVDQIIPKISNKDEKTNEEDTTSAKHKFAQYLGQTLQHMQTAAQKGDTVYARGLMKMFSTLKEEHEGYDGVSAQQEAFEFLDKVLGVLRDNDEASGEKGRLPDYMVQDLFGGQKFSQLTLDHLMRDSELPATQEKGGSTSKKGKGSSKSEPTIKYEPIAFIERDGANCNEGHYWACRKLGNEWFRCNDDKVVRSDPRSCFKKTMATPSSPASTIYCSAIDQILAFDLASSNCSTLVLTLPPSDPEPGQQERTDFHLAGTQNDSNPPFSSAPQAPPLSVSDYDLARPS